MPEFVEIFSMEGTADCTSFTITDEGNYSDEPALLAPGGSTRAVLLTDSNGDVTTTAFPYVSGEGDTITIELPSTDIAYQVEVQVVPAVVVPGSIYTSTQYFASSCNARNFKFEEDQRMFLSNRPKNILQMPKAIIERGELVNRLIASIDGSLEQGNVVQAQLILDSLANLKNQVLASEQNV